ncbi:MAG: hypothetical protein [Caudoviricetes sp.]|nr:MAG: hypothetical protein [Caudoviricetes sp.]
MTNDFAYGLWKSNKISQSDFELNCLFNMCRKHRRHHPETEDNFESLFESIILKLADHEELTDHEWESVQRLYSIHVGTLLIADIAEAFGYEK